MATAADRVLNTSELLEQILISGVNTKTLLLSQRVCAKWRDVIKGSQILQRALFLNPAEDVSSLEDSPDFEDVVWNGNQFVKVWNNHLFKTMNPEFVRVNPLVLKHFIIPNTRWPYHAIASQSRHERSMKKWKNAGAVHRDMLICQPPVQWFCIKARWQFHDKGGTFGSTYLRRPARQSCGVTIFDVFEAVLKCADKDHNVVGELFAIWDGHHWVSELRG